MTDTIWSVVALLAGTFVLRPYVVGFLAFFLAAGACDLGRARTLGFLLWGFVVALGAELWSTRTGVPFGLYHYTGATSGAELYLSNVPFFSPLSFPFLAYAVLVRRPPGPRAGRAGSRAGRLRLVGLSGALMMLPGRRDRSAGGPGRAVVPGPHLLLPAGGELFRGAAVQLRGLAPRRLGHRGRTTCGRRGRRAPACPDLGITLYYLVLAVNLTMTLWIGEILIAVAGIVVHWRSFCYCTMSVG